MLDSIPMTVDITFNKPIGLESEVIDGERKIMLDGQPSSDTVTVQLERDGRKLTQADRLPSWIPGERDGWRAWPVAAEPQGEGDLIDIDAEEAGE